MPCACDTEKGVVCYMHLNIDTYILAEAIKEDEENNNFGDYNEE